MSDRLLETASWLERPPIISMEERLHFRWNGLVVGAWAHAKVNDTYVVSLLQSDVENCRVCGVVHAEGFACLRFRTCTFSLSWRAIVTRVYKGPDRI